MSKEHKHPSKNPQSNQSTITIVTNPFVPKNINVHQHPQTNLHIKQNFFYTPSVNITNNNKDNEVKNHQHSNNYGKKLY